MRCGSEHDLSEYRYARIMLLEIPLVGNNQRPLRIFLDVLFYWPSIVMLEHQLCPQPPQFRGNDREMNPSEHRTYAPEHAHRHCAACASEAAMIVMMQMKQRHGSPSKSQVGPEDGLFGIKIRDKRPPRLIGAA
jgi:hypothetical protein